MSGTATAISSLAWRDDGNGDLLVRGARLFDPGSEIDAERDLLVREGRIAELAEPDTLEAPADGEELDARGLTVFPGFFDPHVHLRTPGQEHKEDLETGTRAAAAGGFCGIVAMANTAPPVDEPEAVAALCARARQEAAVPTAFTATVSRGMAGGELTEMAALREAGAVAFSDDGLPIASARLLRRALQYQHLVGGTVLLHEEDPDLSGDGAMAEGTVSAQLGLSGIPAVSESTMIARDAALCLYEDARAHVQHLSAASSLQAVEVAKSAGARITAEVTPHHLVLTDEAVRSLDSHFKMNPPLRSESDRLALIDGLRSGAIDCIGTDHAPHAPTDKDVPFEQAAMGITGLETAFAVLYTDLVLPGVLDLTVLVSRLGAGAAVFDLEVPALRPGAEANLALVDLEAEWEVGAEGWESRSHNSPFAGRRLRSRPVATVVAGNVVYRQRAFRLGAVA